MKTWGKALIGIAIALVVLLVVAYFGMGYGIYSQLGNVQGSCDTHQANRPDSIQANDAWPPIDLTRYTMSPYETVRFPSREAGIEIAGWWIERDPQAPAVLLVHGFGGCKNAIDVLVPAGMLWRNGFNVLLIDLRDIGESGTDDMRSAIGNDEYLDVLRHVGLAGQGEGDRSQAERSSSSQAAGSGRARRAAHGSAAGQAGWLRTYGHRITADYEKQSSRADGCPAPRAPVSESRPGTLC